MSKLLELSREIYINQFKIDDDYTQDAVDWYQNGFCVACRQDADENMPEPTKGNTEWECPNCGALISIVVFDEG